MEKFDSRNVTLGPIIGQLLDSLADKVAERVVSALSGPKEKEPRYYSRRETARILKMTLPTLARLTKDGLITAKKVGSRILYDAEAIDEAVKERKTFKYKRVNNR